MCRNGLYASKARKSKQTLMGDVSGSRPEPRNAFIEKGEKGKLRNKWKSDFRTLTIKKILIQTLVIHEFHMDFSYVLKPQIKLFPIARRAFILQRNYVIVKI